MRILKPTQQAIEQAAQALKSARLVAFPTETVYGLGADATSAEALKRLYDAKGRPGDHPVIVHLSAAEQLDQWAVDIPDGARKLASALWPGPLTLILRRAEHVLLQVTGGQDTVGLRIPSHPTARELLRVFGGGVAAPSANKFGHLSATAAEDVAHEFEQEVDFVLDGGVCDVGIESTIVDYSRERPRILRPGMILSEQIEALIGPLDHTAAVSGNGDTRAPGMLKSHYAPHTSTALVAAADLLPRVRALSGGGKKVCVLSFQEGLCDCAGYIVASSDPARYAHDLYRNLRQLDRMQADVILVEAVPETDAWAAVADRLKRASAEGGQ